MMKQILKSLHSYEFSMETTEFDGLKYTVKCLKIMPKDFYGCIRLYYTSMNSLKEQLIMQGLTNPSIICNM